MTARTIFTSAISLAGGCLDVDCTRALAAITRELVDGVSRRHTMR